MFRRRESSPTVIVVEVADKAKAAETDTAIRPLEYKPLKTRDPRALVVADLLLNAAEGEDGTNVPEDLRRWARDLLGGSDVR